MRRYLYYINERFSPAQLLPLVLCFGVSVGVMTPIALQQEPTYMNVVVVSIALSLFLLRLRLLDDIKDYAHDRAHHPERPAAQNVVTQRELAVGALMVTGVEFLIASFFGEAAILTFFVLSLYALCLFLEALWVDRLRPYFFTYIAIHEAIVLPLLVYLVFLTSSVGLADVAAPVFMAHFVQWAALFFVLEVVRKIRAPEKESTGVDTYTAQLGITGALALLMGSALVACVGLLYIAYVVLPQPFIAMGATISSLLCMGYAGWQFSCIPTPGRAKTLFVLSGVYVAAALLSIPVALLL